MEGDPTVANGVAWGLRFLSEIAFRWIPGTVQVMTGTAPDMGSRPILTPLTEPVTTTDVVNFLQTAAAPGSFDRLYHDWSVFVAISIMISLFLGAACIYCIIRLMQVRHNEELRFRAAAHTVAAKDVSRTHLRWSRIVEQAHSDDSQAWRLAILEADIMLNELLDVLGYRGETMSDKMKNVERGDFKTIDLAWEAHRARNTIAHGGMMQELSSKETRRVISLYEQVFREFKFLD